MQTRRSFLAKSGALGCSLAASPLLTPVTFASAPWDNRLVVIILRGAMDGLDVVQPYGDKNLAGLRRKLKTGEAGGASDLDGYFALHPALSGLMPLWRAGELGFAHAVSTPYRDKRSHFDGQDLLEAGTGFDTGGGVRDGWLNRMLQTLPGLQADTAFAIGREELLVLSGAADVSSWSPDADLDLTPESQQLLQLIYAGDPLFRDAAGEAMQIAQSLRLDGGAESHGDMVKGMQDMMQGARRGKDHVKIAQFAASRLREETRVAAFSLNGWDTHNNQARGLSTSLDRLSETLLTLRDELGPVWQKTAVLAMTEFGRTVRENGTAGTDHGTGGAMLMAGGAIRGGQVYGAWPGLGEGDLYAGRDLLPTADVRAYAGAAMRGLFGLDTSVLEKTVFPGLDAGALPGIIL